MLTLNVLKFFVFLLYISFSFLIYILSNVFCADGRALRRVITRTGVAREAAGMPRKTN